jgi:hypothetical protein
MILSLSRAFLLATLIASCVAMAQRPEHVGIANHTFAAGSPEAFAASVLAKARAKDYDGLAPLFNWTWQDFYRSWEPDYPWKTVEAAKSDSDIYIAPAVRSKVHKELYAVHYYALDENGRKRGAGLLIVKEGDSFKLAVQANGSDVGNRYVKLNTAREYAEKSFDVVSAEKTVVDDMSATYALPNGVVFRCTYGGEENRLEKLEQKSGDLWVNLYLVIFDPEGTPTVKLKLD